MRRLVLIATAFVATIWVGGCDQQAAKVNFESPQDAYQAFAAAAKESDWGSAAKVLNSESQAMMAVSMTLGATIMAGDDQDLNQKLEKLLAKHGIDMNADPEPPADPENYDPQAERLKLVAPVKDLPVFLDEIGDFMKSTGKESPGGMAEMRELGEVKVDGETAVAMCETDGGPQPIGFIKTESGWVLDLMVETSDEQFRSSGLSNQAPESDGPLLGVMSYGDADIGLHHVMAYRSKFFDDPCIDVVLTAKPVYDRALKRLQRSLQEEGNGMGFFPDGPNIRLSIDQQGKLVDMFAWVDNVSMGLTDLTEIDIQIDGDRISGSAESTEGKVVQDKEFQFEAQFDVELMQFD